MLDFAIFYEHAARELISVELIASELRCRGYRVELLKYPAASRLIRLKARVVVTHSLYGNREVYNSVYRLFSSVDAVINLQWEQIRSVWDDKNPESAFMPRGLARHAYHVCWGEYTASKLRAGGIDPSRILVTGAPQMDILTSAYSDVLRERTELLNEHGIDPSRPIMLFISSFSYATLPEAYIDALKRHYDGTIEVDNFRAFSIQSQEIVLNWLERAAVEYPDITVIYRPHPAERASYRLNKIAGETPNFRVISDYSVSQWIYCSDRIYTWFSTAIGEAFYGGRPCAILRPIACPPTMELSIMQDSAFIGSFEEFRETLTHDFSFPISPDVMHRYYGVEPGMPSTLRIADALERIVRDGYSPDTPWKGLKAEEFVKMLRRDRRAALLRTLKVPVKRLLALVTVHH